MGEESAQNVGSEATAASKASCMQQGPGGAAPGNFLNGLHAKPIGYQYGRFKAVDKTLCYQYYFEGTGGAAPGKFLNGLHAEPIGYQYGRFKAVD